MNVRMATAAVVPLLAMVLVGCGDDGEKAGDKVGTSGSGSLPSGANVTEFCAAFEAFDDPAIENIDASGEELAPDVSRSAVFAEGAEALQAAVKTFRELGVPDGIPDAARQELEDGLDAFEAVTLESLMKAYSAGKTDFEEMVGLTTPADEPLDEYLGEVC